MSLKDVFSVLEGCTLLNHTIFIASELVKKIQRPTDGTPSGDRVKSSDTKTKKTKS